MLNITKMNEIIIKLNQTLFEELHWTLLIYRKDLCFRLKNYSSSDPWDLNILKYKIEAITEILNKLESIEFNIQTGEQIL